MAKKKNETDAVEEETPNVQPTENGDAPTIETATVATFDVQPAVVREVREVDMGGGIIRRDY